MDPKAYRLPQHALPTRYDLHIRAALGEPVFSGELLVQLDVRSGRDTLELHARGLELSDVALTSGGVTLRGAAELDAERELALLRFARALPVGPAELRLRFRGAIGDGLAGLFLAADGPARLLATQCEPTDARAIFPCWDEPTFKASFAVRVTTAAADTVIANGPLVAVDPAGAGERTWRFAPTKPMSSYLFALAIGDLAATPELVVRGTPLRVWALRGSERLGEFALGYTARLLPWYEEYFGVPYHFDKLDQAAMPVSAFGAMENAGLVLYAQSLLLMDPASAALSDERVIAIVVGHEFSHMWFGNLVTMAWWDDLWLNEAFATWVSQKAVDTLSPAYRIWDDAQPGTLGALALDALASTHPIYSPVASPAEIGNLFDAITYQKGCAVMRMLEAFLGEAPFRDGIRAYMRAFAEGNATGADLWRSLQAAANQPVERMMEGWITQPGFPLISVAPADETRAVLHVSQRRFFAAPGAPPGDQLWDVPLVVRYADESGEHEQRFLLATRDAELRLHATGRVTWLTANAGHVGFFRQRLAPELLAALLEHRERLTPAEQVALLSDQWALARSGHGSIAAYLDALLAVASSDDYHVLGAVVGQLHTVERLLEDAGDDGALGRFRERIGALFAPKLARLGFAPPPDDPPEQRLARAPVIDALATLARDQQVIAEVRAWAAREAADPAAVDPNLAGVLVGAAAQFGDAAHFARHLGIYRARRDSGAPPQEHERYLYSFPRFQPPELVQQVLELIDEQVIPLQNGWRLLSDMFATRHAARIAWDYFVAHWQQIVGISPLTVGWIVDSAGDLPAAMRDEFAAFGAAHLRDAAPMSFGQALERMDQEAEFSARVRGELLAWFHT